MAQANSRSATAALLHAARQLSASKLRSGQFYEYLAFTHRDAVQRTTSGNPRAGDPTGGARSANKRDVLEAAGAGSDELR